MTHSEYLCDETAKKIMGWYIESTHPYYWTYIHEEDHGEIGVEPRPSPACEIKEWDPCCKTESWAKLVKRMEELGFEFEVEDKKGIFKGNTYNRDWAPDYESFTEYGTRVALQLIIEMKDKERVDFYREKMLRFMVISDDDVVGIGILWPDQTCSMKWLDEGRAKIFPGTWENTTISSIKTIMDHEVNVQWIHEKKSEEE